MRSWSRPVLRRITCHGLRSEIGVQSSDANSQGQPWRRGSAQRIARAGDASQIVRGPNLESGSTARSPWTCSQRRPVAYDLRAPV